MKVGRCVLCASMDSLRGIKLVAYLTDLLLKPHPSITAVVAKGLKKKRLGFVLGCLQQGSSTWGCLLP